MKIRPLAVATFAGILAAVACSDSSVQSLVPLEPSLARDEARRPNACPGLPKGTKNIVLTPSSVTIETGGTKQLAVKNEAGVDVAWCAVKLSVAPDSTIASVSDSGLVTGVTVGGPVTVTAFVRGNGKRAFSALATVTVTPAAVASVTLSPATSHLVMGGTQQLTAELRDARGALLTGRVVT